MFVLVGDPNAANTTAGMTVKLTKHILICELAVGVSRISFGRCT